MLKCISCRVSREGFFVGWGEVRWGGAISVAASASSSIQKQREWIPEWTEMWRLHNTWIHPRSSIQRERDPPCPGEVNHPADILTNFITIKPTNIQIHIARLSTIYTVSNIASITGYKQEIRCDPSLFRQPYIPFLKSGEVRGNARASLRIDSNAHICASRML